MFVRVTIYSWKSFERTFLTVRLLYKHIKKRKYAADLEEQLRNRMEHMIELRRHKLALLSERLEGVSPVKKLAQGYSYVTDENGHTLTDAEGVKAGDRVKIRLLKGALEAEVTEVLHER